MKSGEAWGEKTAWVNMPGVVPGMDSKTRGPPSPCCPTGAAMRPCRGSGVDDGQPRPEEWGAPGRGWSSGGSTSTRSKEQDIGEIMDVVKECGMNSARSRALQLNASCRRRAIQLGGGSDCCVHEDEIVS